MTWEELRDLLVELSDETRVVSTQGLDTVALNLAPVAWFISMRFNNALNIGVYEGDEHRLDRHRADSFAGTDFRIRPTAG